MQRTVSNEADLTLLLRYLRGRKRPFHIEIADGRRRSTEQNRMQFLWYKEISEQLEDRTPEQIRGYSKLHFGVPILREENPEFCTAYDRVIRPLDYEHKLAAMMVPLDMPVTRIMTVEQKSRYLDAVMQHWLEQGVALTVPEAA